MKNNIALTAKKAREGDARAFGELYSKFSGEMYRYALYSLGSVEAAQDAVQDTALEAWKSINRLRNEEAAKAWFFKILNHCCKHSLREKYSSDLASLDFCEEIAAKDSGESILLGLDLLRLINKLTQEEKDIVLLSAVCGCNSKEIAKITALPAATVRSKLSRSLKKLRSELEKGGNEI